MAKMFNDWVENYDLWFETPMGRLIKGFESELVLRMLTPSLTTDPNFSKGSAFDFNLLLFGKVVLKMRYKAAVKVKNLNNLAFPEHLTKYFPRQNRDI